MSLINEKAITDSERELIITSLFSRSDTGLLKGDYEGIVTERTTEFTVNVSEKPTSLALKVGNQNVAIKEAKRNIELQLFP